MLHARYAREQVLAAFNVSSFEQKSSSREGVVTLNDQQSELLFVTLKKSDKHFSPTTMYHDYALSQELFHWQSQNSARPDRGRGLTYVEQRENNKKIILFVRESAKDENSRTRGFVNFGLVDFVKSSDSQPMNIVWKLREPMPSYLWHETAKLAIG